ncbi:GDP-mannose 4,6-dehydratase [Paractinoplanes rishiriensis]|uniref:GDP-mannose 4,6-dehydratase n=1 Tax=Paractinoplanes rishiriensis TaxID=1050105 RepID=A0A919JUV4_9ACTN|nr:GDP-mannose 4,6-dehydratase [Actinoplanes rishiriensis]GIE95218.1 GDP-mannose 4,6-dehydratase [Actinoplanes rishiriensis]
MRFLITGITGFVGPHLADLLVREGHEVHGLVRSTNGREDDIRDVMPDETFSELRFVLGDLIDMESCVRALRTAEFDGVFHLAAQSHPPTSFADPRGTFVTNAIGTVNLADAIRTVSPSCRMLFCSTSEVYGAPDPALGLISEAFPIAPVNPYGVSKASADCYVRERAISEGLPFFVTRAFSHTGPRRGRCFSIASDAYQIVRILKSYQEPVIRVGTLSSARAVVDVRDISRAYYLLMQHAVPGAAYNVGGEEVFTMGELLDRMLDIAGLGDQVEKRVDPALVRPIDIPVQTCDSSRCRDLTGWQPSIKIDQTLSDLIEYYGRKIS